jgi:hypothetical protein
MRMSTTPNGTRLVAQNSDGEHDITDAVGALYDLAVGSMDYSSGFWSEEDAVPVALLARLCGFGGAEGLEKYAKLAEQTAKDRIVPLEIHDPLGQA